MQTNLETIAVDSMYIYIYAMTYWRKIFGFRLIDTRSDYNN